MTSINNEIQLRHVLDKLTQEEFGDYSQFNSNVANFITKGLKTEIGIINKMNPDYGKQSTYEKELNKLQSNNIGEHVRFFCKLIENILELLTLKTEVMYDAMSFLMPLSDEY